MKKNNELENQALTLGKHIFILSADALSYCWSLLIEKKAFSGRARRKEYWISPLVHFAILILIAGIFDFETLATTSTGKGLLAALGFRCLWVILTLMVRRLHDIGISGWWLWLCLLPMIVPPLVLGYFMSLSILCIFVLKALFQRGQAGDNKYGEDPRDAAGSIADTGFNPVAGSQSNADEAIAKQQAAKNQAFPAIPSATHAERPAPFDYPTQNNSMTKNDANGNSVPFDASIHDDDC